MVAFIVWLNIKEPNKEFHVIDGLRCITMAHPDSTGPWPEPETITRPQLGGGYSHELIEVTEGVRAGLQRLVPQQARAEALERRDRQLLRRGLAEPLLDPLAQLVGGRREHEDRLGSQRVGGPLGQPREALHERGRLAGAGPADDEQGSAAVLDGFVLGGGEHFGN